MHMRQNSFILSRISLCPKCLIGKLLHVIYSFKLLLAQTSGNGSYGIFIVDKVIAILNAPFLYIVTINWEQNYAHHVLTHVLF